MNNLVCPTDEELIPLVTGDTSEAVVETHLRSCAHCQRRVEEFRSDLLAMRSVSTAEHLPPPATLARPARIGKYLIVGKLDSGGQADVYRAVHPMLDKELAIKVSRRPLEKHADHRSLLVAEGKLLAKLEHPNLARIYDLDFHDDLPFLAMEYVRGPNLRQFAGDHPVTPHEAAVIVSEVAQALAVVHKHGVVHQDIKPQNILIDENGQPRLIDFGMARLRHAWDTESENPSGGTAAYMAPEQARGETSTIGPRSDVFALGGVLYFLLTQSAPFPAQTVHEALAQARKCAFDRTLLDKPGIPSALRRICLKAMSANPTDRYGRVEDMVHDLNRYLTYPRRVARFVGGAIAALLLVGLGVGLWAMNQPRPQVQAPVLTAPELEVKIHRKGNVLSLQDALPIQPKTDSFSVIGRVPKGHHALLVQVVGGRTVQRLPFKESPAETYTTLNFPANMGTASFDQGEGFDGKTEAVLLLAAEKPETLENLLKNEDIEFSLLSQPLDPLGQNQLVWLNKDEATTAAHYSGVAEPKGEAQVRKQLEQLRIAIREKNLSVIRGVAYSR